MGGGGKKVVDNSPAFSRLVVVVALGSQWLGLLSEGILVLA